jgi:hypothetical protein
MSAQQQLKPRRRYNAAESVHLGEDGRQKIAAAKALKALGSSTYLVLILAAISQKFQVNMCTYTLSGSESRHRCFLLPSSPRSLITQNFTQNTQRKSQNKFPQRRHNKCNSGSYIKYKCFCSRPLATLFCEKR